MAPFLWAFGSIIVKFMRVKHIKSPLGYLLFIAPTAFLSLLLLFMEPFRNPGLTNTFLLLLSGVLAGLGYYFFIYVLYKEEVSRIITLYGITPLFVLVLETMFLNEMLSPKHYLAFILIISGTFLISSDHKNGRLLRKGVLLIILSSFIWAVHNLLLKLASSTNFSTMMILRETGFLILVLVVLAFSKTALKKTKETIKEFGIKKGSFMYTVEGIGMAGVVFAYLAIQRAPVSLVTLVGGFQNIFTLILAVILSIFFPRIIKEAIDRKTLSIKIISALLMLLGLYFIII